MTHLLPFCLLSAGIMFINHQYRREYSCMAENPMRRDDNLLEQIQSRLESLNKSERKVADAILRDPSAATRYSIADRKSTRLNSSHVRISYAVFCLKKKKKKIKTNNNIKTDYS